jgi:hypothetical protein
MLDGQVERRLPKLLHELARVRFVARGGQLVMDCQAHVAAGVHGATSTARSPPMKCRWWCARLCMANS